MSIVSSTVDYLDDEVLLEAYYAYDDAIDGKRPVVLINHAWGGRDEFVADKANKLAEMGYLAFALDMYGKGVRGTGPDENARLMAPFMKDRAMLQKRVQAGLAAVRLLPWVDDNRIAAIGFCFGGLCVLDLARSGADIAGVVSFHGLLEAPDNIPFPDVRAKILMLHGHDDPMVPVEQVVAAQQEFTRVKADWQMHVYGNTMHAFTNPVANDPNFGTVYQPVTDVRSWLAMTNFFNEVFA